MIAIICLWWIGLRLTAPDWYFVLLGAGMFIKFVVFGLNMFKIGQKNN